MNESTLAARLLASAIRYATDAGELIKRRMLEPYQVGDKLNLSDLVTDVDVGSERLIRERIGRDYPDHWILSEETDGAGDAFRFMENPASGCGWIIDPIDGTINFVHAIPHFAVSIGVVVNGAPLLGVVYNPLTGDLYQACRGGGAFRNGRPIRAAADPHLSHALLATGFPAADWKADSAAAGQIRRVAGQSRNVRILGAASLDLCLVASGRLNGFWHAGLYPWDVAAGLVIVREAGGIVTNAAGAPYALSDRTLVASNPGLQGALLSLLYA